MSQIYKTKKNLQEVWNLVDNACGALDNAFILLNGMGNLSVDAAKAVDGIDFSAVVNLKEEIEMYMREQNMLD